MLCAFDVDATLAPINQAIDPVTARMLAQLQEAGVMVTLASGKPCAYLAGFARAYLCAEEVSLVGENGSDVWVQGIMPAVQLRGLVAEVSMNSLAEARRALETAEQYQDALFFQPNAVNVTAFPQLDSGIATDELRAFVEALELPGIKVYRHVDSIDCVPVGIDKASALRRLTEALGLGLDEVIAVGDSDNDIPMFEVARESICVGHPSDAASAATHVVDTPRAALELVDDIVGARG